MTDDAPGKEAKLFALGLAEYARRLERSPSAGEEDAGTEQKLAERFVRRPAELLRGPERPLMPALAPYLAAAGLIALGGIAFAVYVFQSGPSPDWSVAVAAPKAEAALTSFAPKSAQEQLEERAALAEDEAAVEPLTPADSWAGTVEAFKVLAGSKAAPQEAKAQTAAAGDFLRAVEAWQKRAR